MLNDFLKVGQVINVKGQKVRARIFNNKNNPFLIFNGEYIKNVTVGSMVKIPKGYDNIIGKIEGEYIEECNFDLKNRTKRDRFNKDSDSIERTVEISILGVLDNKKFNRGTIEIPLVFSDVYILTQEEINRVFRFYSDIKKSINIGKVIGYPDNSLYVDVNNLFASHIGIFGNTGSGKSNTLAKIYTGLIDRYKSKNAFINSEFLIIDFNGEYEKAFSNNKNYLKLSTRNDNGDKIKFNSNIFEDINFWSVIFDASEKTQQPFLRKCIDLYKEFCEEGKMYEVMSDRMAKLIYTISENPTVLLNQHYLIIELFGYILKDQFLKDSINSIDEFGVFAKENMLKKGSEYLDTHKKVYNIFIAPILEKLKNIKEISDKIDLFDFCVKYEYIYLLSKNYINNEHIAPLLSRFDRRKSGIKKLITVDFYNEVDKEKIGIINDAQEVVKDSIEAKSNVICYSLVNVNLEYKKIIPMLICKYKYNLKKKDNQEMSEVNNTLHIIIDEAHNILSNQSVRESESWKEYRLETFEEIIKEGRKFGVFLTIASQRPSDISDTIISQLHNYFIHRLVNEEDLRLIGKAVSFIDGASYSLIPILPQGACIFTGTACNFPLPVQIERLPIDKRPISDDAILTRIWEK